MIWGQRGKKDPNFGAETVKQSIAKNRYFQSQWIKGFRGTKRGFLGKFRSQNASFQSQNSPFDVFFFPASFDSKIYILFTKIVIFEAFLCPKIHFLTPNPFSSKKRHFWGHKMAFFVRKQHFCVQVEIEEMIWGPKWDIKPQFWCWNGQKEHC